MNDNKKKEKNLKRKRKNMFLFHLKNNERETQDGIGVNGRYINLLLGPNQNYN